MARTWSWGRWWAVVAVLLLSGLWLPVRSELADDPVGLYRLADRLERLDQWQRAAECYARLVRLQPESPQWPKRLRWCYQQDHLTRRYFDQSFRQKVLSLTFEKALELYGEVLTKIEDNYVEEVKLPRLLAQGLENLDLALQNRTFLDANLPPNTKLEAIAEFRNTLRQRWGDLAVLDRRDAQQRVRNLASGAQLALGVRPTAVLVEFVCAACEALDAHSGYLSPDRLSEVYALVQHNVAGIGLDLRLVDGQLVVSTIVADGPAARAGLQAGDRLLRINEVPTNGMNLEEAALRLLGRVGTRLAISVQGGMESEERRLDVVRQFVAVPSVLDARIVDAEAGVGYIHLAYFHKRTLEELDLALAKLTVQGMRALVLDLRGNPGGSFAAAVQVADRFISAGALVSTRGRAADANAVFRAVDDNNLTMPLVVLIDGESASASEIVAAAVKDHRRGVLIGQKSFGKGSVQRVFPLRTAPAGIRLTTAKFYSPLETTYDQRGVAPDILVERPSLADVPPNQMENLTDLPLQVAAQTARQLLGKR